MEDAEPEDLSSLAAVLDVTPQPKRVGIIESLSQSAETQTIKELRDQLQGLKVVSRAKVTQDRIYSAAYHPEVTKDLIFFGGKLASPLVAPKPPLTLVATLCRQARPAGHMGRSCTC